MRKIFNTSIDEFEIIDIIINYLEDLDIDKIIDCNVILRFQFKSNKNKKKKLDRSVTEEKIKQLYRQDILLKKEIVKIWDSNIILTQSIIKKTKDYNKLIDNLAEDNCPLDIFEHCTILWRASDIELNEIGDKLYDIYNKSVEINEDILGDLIINKKDKGTLNMDNNLMNISIGEFIEKASMLTADLENMKKEMETKENENKKLKQTLETIIDNRDLKKEMKTLNKKINEVNILIENKNTALLKEIKEIKEENQKFKDDIKSISESLKNNSVEILIKNLIKEFTDNQTNFNNALKGGVIESIQKNVDMAIKSLEGKINKKFDKLDTSNTRDIINVDDSIQSQFKEEITSTPQTSNQISKGGLADILNGLELV